MKKLVQPNIIPHLITCFYSNRSNPIPLKNYCSVILLKHIQSYTISLINEFGFDTVFKIWNEIKHESKLPEINEELFLNYEKIKLNYQAPYIQSFILKDGKTLIVDKLKSTYHLEDIKKIGIVFCSYEIEKKKIFFFRGKKIIEMKLK